MKLKNPLQVIREDPFLGTSLTWGLAVTGMNMAVTFCMLQLDSYDQRVDNFLPFLFVLFGAAYLVRFIGRRPTYYTAIFGLTVGVSFAMLGLLQELLQFKGLYYESFARFVFVAVIRGVPLALIGALGGWIMTRGRVPIAIELPTKKEEEEAKARGAEMPGPRIVTPVAEMPGAREANVALLERLEKDPTSLLSDRERRKLAKQRK